MRMVEFLKKTIQQIKAPITFNLREEYCEHFDNRNEIEIRNVLVGALRSREQFSINLQHNFYHIPLDALERETDIEYVALYQSKNLFSNSLYGTGIHYIGKVIKASRVKRGEIHEIPTAFHENRHYVRFDVAEWKKLVIPKRVSNTFPKVYLKTSLFLFENAVNINELKFDTVEKYVIYLGVNDLINELYDAFKLNALHVRRIANTLFFSSHKGKYKISTNKFISNTSDCLVEIYSLM